MSTLASLLEIIATSGANLQNLEKKNSTPLPDLSKPYDAASEAFRADPAAAESAALIVAAASQLVSMLAPPVDELYVAASGGFKAAALRVCHESNVTEILREAGPQGLHAEEIAKKNGLDANKLARFLRFLASGHIYEEVTPDVFRNNRLSSLLDTGKPSAEVLASPERKHDGTKGPGGLFAHILGPLNHAAAYTWENVSDPNTGHSDQSNQCPFSTWQGKEITAWEWLDLPGNEWLRRRFNVGMAGAVTFEPTDTVLDGFDWEKLPKGSTVVDVGGGIGAYMMALANKFPEMKFVVQDTPATIKSAHQVWAEKSPHAVADKRVTLEAQSFFDPQSKRDIDVFFIKNVIHNWGDSDCKTIFTNLRNAAGPNTKLIVGDNIAPYSCRIPEDEDSQDRIPGSEMLKQAPAPLLPNSLNWGWTTLSDMVMLLALGGEERTFNHMQELLLSAGWKVDEVRHPKNQHVVYSFYVASPS